MRDSVPASTLAVESSSTISPVPAWISWPVNSQIRLLVLLTFAMTTQGASREVATWRAQAVRDFTQLPLPFAAVATDVETGEAVVLSTGVLAHAMRASMADLRAGAEGIGGGPAPFAKADRSRFLAALDEALARIARG
jgi:hypothetical protein